MRPYRLDSVASAQVMDHLIRRECARSDRNGQAFSLVLFRVAESGRRRRSMAAHRLARVMLKRARLTDEVGWVGEKHLAALLPDTMPEGAKAFAEGVADIIAKRELRPVAHIYAYPRDARSAPVPELNGIGALAHSNGSSRLHIHANGNGHNGHTNGNGHNGHANGHGNNGHALVGANGHRHANGHGHVNGNGHKDDAHAAHLPSLNGDSRGISATLVREPTTKIAVNFAPAAKRAAQPQTQTETSVESIEDLLAFPMPWWKRALDVIGATMLMIVLSPIFALAAIGIKLTSAGPVIYKQKRSGLGGKPFMIYKFRTMIVGAEKQQQELRKFNEQDGPAFKLTNDPRVTKIGHILRKTSIDELPQLWNIIRGEMSLVGPRPLPVAEQEGCEQWQRHRLNVTPGITCIWQVKGRSTVSFAEWVRMDVEYIRRRTIFHDLTILFSTIPSVLLRKGAR